MSGYVENLGRAARLLQRIADIGGPAEFEGVTIKEIVGDVLMAAHEARLRDVERKLAFRCNVDESAGLAEANVVELLGYSRKAPCA
jgi:hypothetical protein